MIPELAISAALTLTALTLWATNLIPAYLTSLMFFTVAMLAGLAPITVTFAGFTSSALWMIFAGLILGCAIQNSGLALRMGYYVSRRVATAPYWIIIATLIGWGTLLSFIMPAALGRIVLTLPIVLSLAQRLGFSPDSRGYTGLILATGSGCFFPAFGILPSNVPNIVWMGAIETLNQGTIPLYATYLLLHFPILGLVKAAFITLLIVILYQDSPNPPQQSSLPPPLSSAERFLIALLTCGLVLWMSDFIHHISPAWIGLALALICLFPRASLVPERVFLHIDLQPFFYVAGIISLGAVIHHVGLGDFITRNILSALPLDPNAPEFNWAIFILLSLIIGLFATLPGIPIILTPLAPELASLSGLSIDNVLMLQVLGFSTVFFPYQSPPLMIALQLGKVSLIEGTKFCLILSLATILLLFPLTYLWWKLLGWL